MGARVMALARDLADLPKAEPERVPGFAPDTQPRFVHLLAESWRERNDAEGERPTAIPDSRFRFSDAAKCARAISYRAAGIPKSNPMDLTGVWNTSLGSLIHDHWQTALRASYPDAEIEVKVVIDGMGSGHGDATVRLRVHPADCEVCGGTGTIGHYQGEGDGFDEDDCDFTVEWVIVIELKSCGGYAYKAAVGKMSRGKAAEGPKTDHMVQASLAGLAQDADEVVIAYLAKECISANVGAGMPDWARFCAEWTLTREQYEPLAREEVARVTGILDLVDKGMLAARKVPFETPPNAEIVDVRGSRWEQRDTEGNLIDTGTVWNGSLCHYCAWFDTCANTLSGRIPVASVKASAA